MEAHAHFSREEINNTVWEVPEKYTRLKQIGTGAYGSVWWVTCHESAGLKCVASTVTGLCLYHVHSSVCCLFMARFPSLKAVNITVTTFKSGQKYSLLHGFDARYIFMNLSRCVVCSPNTGFNNYVITHTYCTDLHPRNTFKTIMNVVLNMATLKVMCSFGDAW